MIGRPAPTSHTKSPSTRTACKARLHGTSGQGQRRGGDPARPGSSADRSCGTRSIAATGVRACVRDVDDDRKVGFLKAMNPYASGRLTLHAADLDEPGCFDDDLPGLRRRRPRVARQHVRRPRVRPPHVRPHHRQRRDVGHRCAASSSRRASRRSSPRPTSTSSPAARCVDEDREPDESNPKRTPERGQGYSMGKVIAQHAFADAAASERPWDAITVCPATTSGPILSRPPQGRRAVAAPHRADARGAVRDLPGHRPVPPVDDRRRARRRGLPRRAARERPVANGERYLAWSTETRNYEDICPSIDRVLPELHHDPGPIADNTPERLKEREDEFRSIWAGLRAAQRPHPRRRADHVPPARRLDPRLRRVTPRRRQCDPEPPTRLTATLIRVRHAHGARSVSGAHGSCRVDEDTRCLT